MFLRGFDEEGREVACLSFDEDPVQEDGLPDSAQADHQKALGGETVTKPVERDLRILDQRVAPHQFGWRRACAGRIRVGSTIQLY